MTWNLLLRMVLAIVVGGVMGAERESRDKAAGFRTMTLICLGSCMFTIMSIRIGGDTNAARIAAQIVSGVGFLGAGVIMRDGGRITGITTAATVWLTASLGIGLGAGYVAIALVAAGLTAAVLLLFPLVEHQIDRRRESILYCVTCDSMETARRLEDEIADHRLATVHTSTARNGATLTYSWTLVGSHERHAELKARWLADPTLAEVSC
jgi:putative Mg2+ transporter-C (MgtC) family protein